MVAGMHRSGTSLFASFLSASGINMGEQLVGADAANRRGYFEDTAFLDLNRKMLLRATPESEGHRDWGWTLCERLDRSCFEENREAAKALISMRRSVSGVWGWKDPRTTLTLDFWHERLIESDCNPLYVFLYRFPWDVADSMQRLGADVFLRHPEYAWPIWSFYNRHLLSFLRRHREHCLLLSSNAQWHEPERSRSLLAERLGVELTSSPAIVNDETLWQARTGAEPLVALMAAASPGCLDLLSELDSCADLSAAHLWTSPRRLRLVHEPAGVSDPVDLSLIIPCHNHGEFLIEAIASAERFAPDGCELIVVNDGSNQPRTLEVLEAIRNAGYWVIDEPHSGLAAARNRGIALARGRYILPLDADNRICEGFAEEAIRVLDGHPGVGVVYGDRYDFGKRHGRAHVPAFDLDTILLGNYIDACAVYRKALWSDCGGYDVRLSALEDWELWIAASERGWQFHHLDAVTFEYRVRPESLVSSTLIPEVLAELRTHVLHKHSTLFLQRMPAIVLEVLREPTQHPILPMERLITGCAALLRDIEADRTQWIGRASAAERELIERNARLHEIEADRAQWSRRYSEIEEEIRNRNERLAEVTSLLEEREGELASIQASATWRWSRQMLAAGPVRWLFGPIIHFVAKRSQRTRLRRSASS